MSCQLNRNILVIIARLIWKRDHDKKSYIKTIVATPFYWSNYSSFSQVLPIRRDFGGATVITIHGTGKQCYEHEIYLSTMLPAIVTVTIDSSGNPFFPIIHRRIWKKTYNMPAYTAIRQTLFQKARQCYCCPGDVPSDPYGMHVSMTFHQNQVVQVAPVVFVIKDSYRKQRTHYSLLTYYGLLLPVLPCWYR